MEQESETLEQVQARQSADTWRLPAWPLGESRGSSDAARALHSALGDLHALNKAHGAAVGKLQTDPAIPNEGRGLLIAEEQRKTSQSLKDWGEKLEQARADLSSLRERMLGDARGVAQSTQSEVRGVLREMKAGERMQVVQNAIRERDVAVLAAVVRTPPSLQTLPDDVVEAAGRALNGDHAALHDELASALSTVEAAASMTADRIAGRAAPSFQDRANAIRAGLSAQSLADRAKGMASKVFG